MKLYCETCETTIDAYPIMGFSVFGDELHYFICPNCGIEIDPIVEVEEELEHTCPYCEEDVDEGDAYCRSCGAELRWVMCEHCEYTGVLRELDAPGDE